VHRGWRKVPPGIGLTAPLPLAGVGEDHGPRPARASMPASHAPGRTQPGPRVRSPLLCTRPLQHVLGGTPIEAGRPQALADVPHAFGEESGDHGLALMPIHLYWGDGRGRPAGGRRRP